MNRYSSRASVRPFLPSYNQNAVVHLILATGVCFVAMFFTEVCFQAFGGYQDIAAEAKILSFIGLPFAKDFLPKAWTLLSYGFFNFDFMGWVGNAIWIFTWGGVLQMLVGYRQVIPVFVLGNLLGGAFMLLAQLIPGVGGGVPMAFVGSHAGVMALAIASFMFAPGYRFWLTPTFSISIKVVLAIFILLHFGGVLQGGWGLCWVLGGAAGGALWVMLLKRGYRIGDRIYESTAAIGERFTPSEPSATTGRRGQARAGVGKGGVTRVLPPQARVDALLEKIHAKGYNALTKEEKEFLKNEGSNI